MSQSLRALVSWGLFLAASMWVGSLWDVPKSWFFQVLPISIAELSRDWWLALALTFSGSLVAWVAAVGGGNAIGTVAAALYLDSSGASRFKRLARGANEVYRSLFIIPFVLTISFVMALNTLLHVNYDVHRALLGIATLAISGVVLGGYHVFRSIFEAVANARAEDLALVRSLWKTDHGKPSKLRRDLQSVKALRDCRIESFCEQLKLAFHLSLVAVIILETVSSNYYEAFFPQGGIAPEFLGGVGRMILKAQQNTQFVEISGCIWMVLIVDMLVTSAMDLALDYRWLRHYREAR